MNNSSHTADTDVSGQASAVNAEASPKGSRSRRQQAKEERGLRRRAEHQAKLAAMTDEELAAYGCEIVSWWR